MNTRAFALAAAAALALASCAAKSVVPSAAPSPVPGQLQLGAPLTFSKAAYVDAFATGAMAQITASGWQTPNILVLAFADPTTAASNATIAGALSTAASNRS